MLGDGRTIVGASYFSGRPVPVGKNTDVGNPARVTSTYNGPAGQGLDFAPGFDLANYTVTSGSFPSANIFYEDGVHSPLTKEMTLSIGRNLGHGFARAMYVRRNTTGLVESFIDDPTAAGKTVVVLNGTNFGTFDNVYYRNTDAAVREYQAMQFEGQYRLQANWSVNGHYTLQIKDNGNYEGEAANQPGIGSPVGDYPELLVESRDYPMGRLDDFQRHKIRVWSNYAANFGRFGGLAVAPVWRYNSALTYSLVANSVPLSAIQRSRNPGSPSLPPPGAHESARRFLHEEIWRTKVRAGSCMRGFGARKCAPVLAQGDFVARKCAPVLAQGDFGARKCAPVLREEILAHESVRRP